jgi:hypothetical protein
MAMGSTANQNIGTVKSTCASLEVSPSHKSQTSNVYASGGHTVKQKKHSSGGKTHAGKRGTKETPQKLTGAHHKRGH